MSTAALHRAFAKAGVDEELIKEAIEEITEANTEVVTKSYLDLALDSALARLETRMTKQLYSVAGIVVIANIAAMAMLLAIVRTF